MLMMVNYRKFSPSTGMCESRSSSADHSSRAFDTLRNTNAKARLFSQGVCAVMKDAA